MKGYCEWCGCEIDDVEFITFDGAHETCSKVILKAKHPKLKIKRGNKDLYYECNTAEWNFWLNRFYPKAELVMEVEYLNNGLGIVKA